MRLSVTVDGTPYTLEPTTPDLVQWERYARQQSIPLDQDSPDFPRITHISFVAYAAGRRLGRWSQTFDKWLDHMSAIEAVEEDPAADAVGNE